MSQSPAAKPFVNPFSRIKDSSKAGNQIFIEPQAQRFFDTLNGYDQFTVAKGIDNLRSVKYPVDGGRHTWRPMFWRVKKDPGVIGNYLISYEVFADRVTVLRISINRAILFSQSVAAKEKNALYQITRQSDSQLHKDLIPTKENLAEMRRSWGRPNIVTSVNTEYAAVNGMLNNFEKAVWLMGVHVDNAYRQENPRQYTLFHNTSQEKLPDFYESVRDQLGFSTENAKHLAAVLQQIQMKGKPVKWVVHSQGGIIFKEAVRLHLKKGGGSLNNNSVTFHSGGNNKIATDKLLARAGIKKSNPDKDNPFDLVPNLAGLNNLSCSSIKRCAAFWPKVADSIVETESPHTLPFISLEFYRRMLVHAGDQQRAEKVANYMKKSGVA